MIVKGTAWGSKSYPLATFSENEQVKASILPAAVGKAARMLADRMPEKKRLIRMTLDVTRV